MKNPKTLFERIYKKPKEAGWTFEQPPKEIIELVQTGKIKPCKVLEIGCGEGVSSIFLASKGFQVTGIDWSETAIKTAKQNAKKSSVSCKFLAMDFEDMDKLKQKFDFIFDWRFLHDIVNKNDRKKYVKLVNRCLNKRGKYLSVSFSKEDPEIKGRKKIIKSSKGVLVYFASMEELEQLFKPHFKVAERKIIRVPRKKRGERLANYFFMNKI